MFNEFAWCVCVFFCGAVMEFLEDDDDNDDDDDDDDACEHEEYDDADEGVAPANPPYLVLSYLALYHLILSCISFFGFMSSYRVLSYIFVYCFIFLFLSIIVSCIIVSCNVLSDDE